jgi:hypothetical protein
MYIFTYSTPLNQQIANKYVVDLHQFNTPKLSNNSKEFIVNSYVTTVNSTVTDEYAQIQFTLKVKML